MKAMYMALQQLGFHPWHVAEAVGDPKRSFSLATEALNASSYPREGETAYSTADFDRWIGGYDVRIHILLRFLYISSVPLNPSYLYSHAYIHTYLYHESSSASEKEQLSYSPL